MTHTLSLLIPGMMFLLCFLHSRELIHRETIHTRVKINPEFSACKHLYTTTIGENLCSFLYRRWTVGRLQTMGDLIDFYSMAIRV